VSKYCLWCSVALQSYILWISCLCQHDHSIEVADPDFIDVVTVQDERQGERRSVTVAIIRKLSLRALSWVLGYFVGRNTWPCRLHGVFQKWKCCEGTQLQIIEPSRLVA